MSWNKKMENTFWLKQTKDKALFPDLLWSRPEHRNQAGKLLVIGGNLHGFAAPAEAYAESGKAGAGTVRVLLPDALKKIAGQVLESVDFAPSTPSGSFNQQALGELLDHGTWANAVLVAGDLGRNSETAILLEKFVNKFQGMLVITKDAIDYFKDLPLLLFDRPATTLVLSMAQLQRLCQKAGKKQAVTFSMDLIKLVDFLHELTTVHPCNIIVKHLDNILVSAGGRVSTTKLEKDIEIWRVKTASHAAIWWLQNSTKPFEALTTSVNH
jgi:NAD(P)H-hydrate repair Nnr-like enzyme with NAD(P)H-hydrate dehydratase domain